MTTQQYIELEERFGAHNYHPLDIVITRGEGVWLTDVEGKRYLDCLASYSAVNQGHCHPKILQAFTEQAQKLTLTSRAFRNDQLPLLYEELHDLTGYDMVLPMNSGSEAVETAVKAVRKWGYTVKGIPENKAEIICASGNFHGRTTTIISFSTEEQYRFGFGPYTPGFPIVRYGDIADLKSNINRNTAAFLVEPIQGEAGIIVPPDGYLREAARLCKENDVLLVADEIQSGLGRSGKALGGGFYPISAVLSHRDVLGVFRPGDHGSTFGGNPLAAATARAALRVIVEENLVQRSYELGNYFMEQLRSIRCTHLRQVRGRGLWIGLVLDVPARPYCEALKDRGVLCKETHECVIRIAPPLVITREEIDWAFEQIRSVLTTLTTNTGNSIAEKGLVWQT
jgi:ornithine--oxo-acid transaminase